MKKIILRPSSASPAFTVVELLIVLAISAMLSALAITYSSAGRNAVALYVEASKISQFVIRAKELSIATYSGASSSCGFGVYFDIPAEEYSLFNYKPAGAPPCPQLAGITTLASGDMQQYTPGTWRVPLSRGLSMKPAADNLVAVLFYPPTPDVLLSSDGAAFPVPARTLKVRLATVDGNNSVTISVNPEGQAAF